MQPVASAVPLHSSRSSSETGADDNRLPSTTISRLPGTVSPEHFGGNAVFCRYFFDSRHVRRVARDHNPAGIFAKEHEFWRQVRLSFKLDVGIRCLRRKPHLASATASPPSEQSCAESTSPDPISSMIAFCSAASSSSSSAGGNPHSSPRISLAYSEEPNSTSASSRSPGSDPRSRTTASAGFAGSAGTSALFTSSRTPTIPRTGVG